MILGTFCFFFFFKGERLCCWLDLGVGCRSLCESQVGGFEVLEVSCVGYEIWCFVNFHTEYTR